jgi:hypothetical protein
LIIALLVSFSLRKPACRQAGLRFICENLPTGRQVSEKLLFVSFLTARRKVCWFYDSSLAGTLILSKMFYL